MDTKLKNEIKSILHNPLPIVIFAAMKVFQEEYETGMQAFSSKGEHSC